MDKVKELKELSLKVEEAFNGVKKEACQEVDKIQDLDGVTHLSTNTMIVKSSLLSSHPWDVGYYDTNTQTREVKKVLNKAASLIELKGKVDKLLEDKFIKISNDYKLRLNENTLKILANLQEELSV